jgi:hypothetical protein
MFPWALKKKKESIDLKEENNCSLKPINKEPSFNT